MKDFVEKEFGAPDEDAHYLYSISEVSNKIAFAITFHLIAASIGLDLFESKKYLNKFTIWVFY